MKPYTMAWNGRRLDMTSRTLIMGILNVTPDSFSDGGLWRETDKAVAHGLEMVSQGADIIDIGGESTRPFSDPVSVQEEIDRVVPVIERLNKEVSVPISIDTMKAAAAEAAVKAGASIINDVSAFNMDPQMAETAAKAGVPVILMHMAGTPKTMQEAPQYKDVVAEVRDYLGNAVEKAVEAGISRDLVIVDPGIGFGKTVLHNLLLIKHLDALDALNVPVLLGPSRKSFIRKILTDNLLPGTEEPSMEDIETGTQAVLASPAAAGVHIVRVHDVPRARTTMLLANAIAQAE
ncbi:dihydropteroate synthase [Desulfatibacillum aliphaticivorans]|uniref:dihydropteroate synthase n=1 Tax=Desulfatibacillum aliphaticivorans TaxID=218208 RepID=UPI000419E7AE|nr:dihydropteroate synthase [Desulfatibacillum aliphaticivorans]